MAEANGDGARKSAEAARARLLRQAQALMLAGAGTAGKLTIGSIRGAMPLLEALSGLRANSVEGGDEPGSFGLKRGQIAVLNALATKVMLESIEIASVTHPVYENAPRYVAVVDGVRQTPHLVHLLAFAAAVRALLEREEECDSPDNVVVPPDQTVAYLAVGPGEYALRTGPLPPIEIRRAAMRQRAFTTPEPAMLVRGSDPAMIAPASSGQPMMITRAQATSVAARSRSGCGCRGGNDCGCGCGGGNDCGCGCGGQGQSCGCGGSCDCGRNHRFAPARLNPDGSCAPIGDISCDTRWRVRECFKVALCDFVRCLGDEICDENCRFAEEPDLGRCVEGLVCTLLGCLPDAICPPPEKPVRCPPARAIDCACNFAVGE